MWSPEFSLSAGVIVLGPRFDRHSIGLHHKFCGPDAKPNQLYLPILMLRVALVPTVSFFSSSRACHANLAWIFLGMIASSPLPRLLKSRF